MNIKLILISFLIILAGCSDKVSVQTINKEDTIVAFGDSLTYGYGASAEEAYPYKLSEITGYKVINEGISGDTASNGKERIKEVVQNHNPKLVLLSLGANDMLRQNARNIESDLNSIIDYLKLNNIETVIIAEPQPSLLAGGFGLSDAKVYKIVADKQQIVLIEDIFSSLLSKDEFKSDLIHLNAKGYQKVAENVAKKLKSVGYLEY